MSADHVTFCPLLIKGISEDLRQITGIASTNDVDRDGEVMDIATATFRGEVPLIWQHEHKMPAIGTARLFKDGSRAIKFSAQFAKLDEPGALKDRVDMAWQSVKSGLVKFISIGAVGGHRQYRKDAPPLLVGMEVVEISTVTIPANAAATIDSVKALYGRNAGTSVRLLTPAQHTQNLNGAVRLK